MTGRKVTISLDAPVSPSINDGWIHSITKGEKIWNGSAWVSHMGNLTVSGVTVVDAQPSPTSWTELDLSSVVGTNNALVILAFSATGDMNATAVRRKGDTDEYYSTFNEANACGVALGHHDSTSVMVLICATDAAGVIEWITETSRTAIVKLMAYIR